jgi:hypothetical protein
MAIVPFLATTMVLLLSEELHRIALKFKMAKPLRVLLVTITDSSVIKQLL